MPDGKEERKLIETIWKLLPVKIANKEKDN